MPPSVTGQPHEGGSVLADRPMSAANTTSRQAKKRRTLEDLKPHVRDGRYRLARHAVRHATAEGFTEQDVVATLLMGRELVRYLEDERLLVLGWLAVSPSVRVPLHVVAEFSKPRFVDVVTAFIPDDPHRAISRERLAEVLRWDRARLESEIQGRSNSD